MNLEEVGELRESKQITFISDSEATDHFINKSLIFNNSKRFFGEIIKSVNKNKTADT